MIRFTFHLLAGLINLGVLIFTYMRPPTEPNYPWYQKTFYFTNQSQIWMSLYFIIVMIREIQNINIYSDDRVLKLLLFNYSLSTSVTVGYWRLILTDYSLLVNTHKIESDPLIHPLSWFMVFIHGGNTFILFIELVFADFTRLLQEQKHQFGFQSRSTIIISYFIFYCGLQYIHKLLFDQHVYPFMNQFSWLQFIFFYWSMLVVQITLDRFICSLIKTINPQVYKTKSI